MNFSEEFARNKGQPIVVDGRSVVGIFRRSISSGSRIRVIWRSAIETPVQGICMKVYGGEVSSDEAGATNLSNFVLWRDTAPDEEVFVCHSKKIAEVRVWNCWRDDRDVMQAWIGNAGMRVVETGLNTFRVECNSRFEVTFSDLVFELAFEGP